jgi:hypothetical protein
MKAIKYICFVAMATLLMAADCSNKDSEFYNDVFVTTPVQFTVNSTGQTLEIATSIPRRLEPTSLANPLDIYRTTGGATQLIFSYELEKQNTDGSWEFIEFTQSNISQISGQSEFGSFVVGAAVYDVSEENYDYQAVIQGLSAGSYRLSFGYNSTASGIVEFRSNSINNNLFLNLNSPVSFFNSGDYFTFSIN